MDPARNLVLVHTERLQARSDFERIAAKARRLDETTNVCVAENARGDGGLVEDLAVRPTLVFSPVSLKDFAPRRGTVFQGRAVDKLTQYRRFLEHDIRTPMTALLDRRTILSEAEWGEYVVVKPLAFERQSSGRSVYLIKTKRLNRDIHIANLFDRYDLPGGVIVQRFVNSGQNLEYHRVLALFGRPLYVLQTRLIAPIALDEKAHINGTIPIANLAFTGGEKDRDFVSDKVFFDIAEACHRAFPDLALQAIDVLRDRETGHYYVIETNLGGNTWHFSSEFLKHRITDDAELKRMTDAKIRQFGAFDVAARVLVEQTRLHAT